MKQKLIQIGSSGGVTIPKNSLEEIGAKIGDPVETNMDSVNKTFTIKFQTETLSSFDLNVVTWTDEFISKNRELLNRLKNQ